MTDLKLTPEQVKEIEAVILASAREDLLAALEENERRRAALKKVAKWDDHRCEWPADEQRDFYRRIALDALGMTYEEVSE